MKKQLALIWLIMALVSLSALVAAADTETSLWPAYAPVTRLWGWFDTESGYISGLCWTDVASYDDSPYVIARVRFDASTEAYINRSGEIVYQWPALEDD